MRSVAVIPYYVLACVPFCNSAFPFPQGAWGGGLLMSRKHRHKLNGIER